MNYDIIKGSLKKIFLILKNEDIFFKCTMISLALFTATTITGYGFQNEGISLIEVSMLTILPGIYFMLLIMIGNTHIINRHNRNSLSIGNTPIKRFYLILIVLFTTFSIYLFIDFIFFSFDDSLSVDFAKSLGTISPNSELSKTDLEEYAKNPFSIQTGIITFSFGIIGALFSLIFIKKDGQLIKSSFRDY